MFKKDLSNIRIISEKLDFDSDIMSAVLACATKRIDLLQENFKTLSYKLGINNTFALRSLLNIACGNKKLIYDLQEKKNSYFNIQNSDLLEAIMFLTKEGTKMKDEHTRFDIKDSTFACQEIYDALKEVMGITNKKFTNSENQKSNISKSFMSKSDNDMDMDLSIENVPLSQTEDFNLKDLMDKEDALLANIKLLVDSCWNDGKALSILADNICTSEKRDPGSVNPIWVRFPDKGKEILTKKLRGVYEGAIEALAIMDNVMAKKIGESMKYIQALENGDEIPLENLTEEEQKIISQLRDSDARTAYKIGCTYNITGFRELNQEFLLCESCEKTTGEDVVICLCCAEFCHKGHRLMKVKFYSFKDL
jgi:antitoxin component of RelBE/YafQ-DinJ toxin-antitoxin module